jgi:hypothetical protein
MTSYSYLIKDSCESLIAFNGATVWSVTKANGLVLFLESNFSRHVQPLFLSIAYCSDVRFRNLFMHSSGCTVARISMVLRFMK